MIQITYEIVGGKRVVVLVGVSTLIDAQRLAKASDDLYQRMVDYKIMTGEVYFVREI
jgi:hypothetical protein